MINKKQMTEEDSILHMGLTHNIGETGSITKPLALYLGTEILFSLIGYNGEIFQQFAKDFYDQIRLANSGGQKKITLHYFSEIKKEIEEFFGIAGEIVEGKRPRLRDKPAMKAITDGCSTSSDVAVKQSFIINCSIAMALRKIPMVAIMKRHYSQPILNVLNMKMMGLIRTRKKKLP